MNELDEVKALLVEPIARAFHEAYERLAPAHGYETRKASAKPWSEVPKNNRDLMVATVMALVDQGMIRWPPGVTATPAEYPMSDNGMFFPKGYTDDADAYGFPPPVAEAPVVSAVPGYWNLGGSWSASRVDGLCVEAGSVVLQRTAAARIEGPCDWWDESAFSSRAEYGLHAESTAGWLVHVPTINNSKIGFLLSGSTKLSDALRAVDRILPPPSWVKTENP